MNKFQIQIGRLYISFTSHFGQKLINELQNILVPAT